MSGKAYVIGAGVSGLAAATRLARAGVTVELSDGAAQAGGRCRSYFDPQLGLVLDNGNHLVLSGNDAVFEYLRDIGSADRMAGPDHVEMAFVDLASGEPWTIRPNDGPLPWWIASPARRVPGTTAGDYLALGGLLLGKAGARVKPGRGRLWERLMHPFLLAALNTEPADADAGLAAAVIRGSLARGGAKYLPRIAEPTLGAAFVEPALARLAERGASVRLGRRLRRIRFAEGRVESLDFADGSVEVGSHDAVVLAAPPAVAAELVPGLAAPTEHRAIVNGHFKLPAPAGAPPILGVVGGTVEWIFAFADRICVTISGADRLVDMDRAALAELMWRDVARALDLPAELPPWQVVKEKRATFAATPEQNARRPGARTAYANLVLAGDWTQTGLPATLEGSVRSGFRAADLALAALRV